VGGSRRRGGRRRRRGVGVKRRKVQGSRRVEDNVSDLRAQVAANQRGILLIGELVAEYGLDVVQVGPMFELWCTL